MSSFNIALKCGNYVSQYRLTAVTVQITKDHVTMHREANCTVEGN